MIKIDIKHLTPKTPRSKIPKTLLKEAQKKGGLSLERSKKIEEVFRHNRKLDRIHKSLPPGKRLSKNGKVYYEYRVNRTDKRKYL